MLRLNGINWKVTNLGSNTLLLEPMILDGHLEYIHQFYLQIESEPISEIVDVIPAYKSIALFHQSTKENVIEILKQIDWTSLNAKTEQHHIVKVDYDLGLDWNRVCEVSKLSKSEIIERHAGTKYTVAMIGFLPGFIFLKGLELSISVPRLENPRTAIPAGSIGIGGNQTGIYSLESPGGWNIIGKTTHQFFNMKNDPPISISPGDSLTFNPVNS